MRCAIIGGGISGLSAAYYLSRKAAGLDIDLYEAGPRLGGVLRTVYRDHCIVEGGPDSFLTQKQAASRLCAELDIELTGSQDEIRKTFVYHDGRLKRLPEGFMLMVPTKLWPLVKTDLISWPGKLAALRDLFFYPQKTDTTVAEFIEDRFGGEVLTNIAEPMLSGVYGGDVRNLSVKNAVPMIWELQKRGSLIHAMLRSRRGGVSGQSLFTTVRAGMAALPEAIKAACPSVAWKTNARVEAIEKSGALWRIGNAEYELLLLATTEVPELRSANGARIGELIRSVRKNSAVVVSICFENIEREGFGWLVPDGERRSVMACTYVNNKFPGRAPRQLFLVRAFIGGRQAAEWIDRDDADIVAETLSELKRIAGIDKQPRFHEIHRWRRSMPEYAVGHDTRIAEIRSLAAGEGSLYLTGNIYQGIGVPDCIQQSEKVAGEIAERCK